MNHKRRADERRVERIQFGERQFDWIEVETIGREKPEMCANALDRPELGWLVSGTIIEHTHVAGPQRVSSVYRCSGTGLRDDP